MPALRFTTRWWPRSVTRPVGTALRGARANGGSLRTSNARPYVVTYTSMPIEADSPEEAIARDGNGGGNRTAVALPDDPYALTVNAYVDEGDEGRSVGHLTIRGLSVHCYQHTDADGALAVVEVDHATTCRARVYADDARLVDTA